MEPSSSSSSSLSLGKGGAILGREREEFHESEEEGGSGGKSHLRKGDLGVSDISRSLGYLKSYGGGKSIIGAGVQLNAEGRMCSPEESIDGTRDLMIGWCQ